MLRRYQFWPVLALIALSGFFATPATACTVSASVTTDFGAYSPPAVKAAAVPALPSRAGLSCPSGVLVLIGNNYVRATFKSRNGLKLSGSAGAFDYTASADSDAAVQFAQNGTVDYMQNNLLNLLGLLGGSNADLPFYVKPKGGVMPATGSYADQITITWDWYLCTGVGALGLCVGTLDKGTGQAIIDVTMTVEAKTVTTKLTTLTTWDAANGTRFPKAIPGSRQRTSLTLANPDIVPLDSGSVAIVLATPGGSRVALDGDGSSTGAAIQSSEGSAPSTLAVSYADPASANDDVDFSADGGSTWSYAPIVGNPASEAAVTHVRVRPRGSMAKQSSFSVSVPYMLQ